MFYEVQLWGCVSALLGLPAELIPQMIYAVPDDVNYYTSVNLDCQLFSQNNYILLEKQPIMNKKLS